MRLRLPSSARQPNAVKGAIAVLRVLRRMIEKPRAKGKEQEPLFSSPPPNPAFDRTRVMLWPAHSASPCAGRSTRALGVNIRPTRIRKLPDQPIFEAFSQGIQPYVLDGNALLAGWAELAAPLGLAYMEPVGRPVTGARETVFFDKGVQQQRAVAIAVLPVPRKLPGRQPQYLGCEVV